MLENKRPKQSVLPFFNPLEYRFKKARQNYRKARGERIQYESAPDADEVNRLQSYVEREEVLRKDAARLRLKIQRKSRRAPAKSLT